MTDVLTIHACTDCMVAVANDDFTGMDLERETAVRAGIRRWNTDGFLLTPDGTELRFSGTPCEVCLSPLAGDRHLLGALDHHGVPRSSPPR